MSSTNIHSLWLSLMDRSGPFLSPNVLESAFPQGLEAFDSKIRRKVNMAYEEWREACENDDPLKDKIHNEWVNLILFELLEYDDTCLVENEEFVIKIEEFSAIYKPKYYIKIPSSKNIRFFIDVLNSGEDLDQSSSKDKWPSTITERMLAICRNFNVRYGLVTNGEKWALISAPIGFNSGIGIWYSRLWRYEPITLKSFQNLLGVRKCFGPQEQTLGNLLDLSLTAHEEVTNTLGEQVKRAVEVLVQALDSADADRNRELLKDVNTKELYEASVTVMMRLVFLLCAEERGLLLLGEPIYDQFYAITTLRSLLSDEAERLGPEILERRYDAWARMLATFRVIYSGIEHETLRLPPLGGTLFNPDKYPFLEGRTIGSSWKDSNSTSLPIDNRTVLLLLTALQVLGQKGGVLLLSYKSLNEEQIGHVYEGLLDRTIKRVDDVTLSLEISKKISNSLFLLFDIEDKLRKSKADLVSFLEQNTGKKYKFIETNLGKDISDDDYGRLLLSCRGNAELAKRIKPFYYLLQSDIWGAPLIYHANSFAVTIGIDRRDSGTHYTPNILTEKIVESTLNPLLYNGPEIGAEKKNWILKESSEILKLRICDSAMGSAAFLVQACKYISVRLIETWDKAALLTKDRKRVDQSEQLSFLNQHEKLLYARRLVAENCLYGVDANPLAVELAKLSLWLVTMSKGKPFEFLDHNFKSGDSLLGISESTEIWGLFQRILSEGCDEDSKYKEVVISYEQSLEIRRKIGEVSIVDIRDVERKRDLNQLFEKKNSLLMLFADFIIALKFSFHGKVNEFNSTISSYFPKIRSLLSGSPEASNEIKHFINHHLTIEARDEIVLKKPFHWCLEFPEIFSDNKGFDAIVGNPPFLGGKKIRTAHGLSYLLYITNFLIENGSANADLCSFFLTRNINLLKSNGFCGMLLSSAITEGETRKSLEKLLNESSSIVFANSRMSWPGKASVTISMITMIKGAWNGKCILNTKEQTEISSYLEPKGAKNLAPQKIPENASLSFIGSYPNGKGFVISEEEKKSLIKINKMNEQVIYPYLIGKELNADPKHSPSKWILNFHDWPLGKKGNSSGPAAEDFPDCLNILRERVYPIRTRKKANGEFSLRNPLPQKWWQYADKRPQLYRRFAKLKFAYAIATQATKYVAFGRVSGKIVFSHSIAIIASDSFAVGSVISSNLHEVWARKYGGYNLLLIRYSPSDLLETFPFPKLNAPLEEIGEYYFTTREKLMEEKNIGLTDLLNKVNNPSDITNFISSFRDVQVKLDQVVLESYGWGGIKLNHNFYETDQGTRYTICPQAKSQVLEKLLDLNLQITSEKSSK